MHVHGSRPLGICSPSDLISLTVLIELCLSSLSSGIGRPLISNLEDQDARSTCHPTGHQDLLEQLLNSPWIGRSGHPCHRGTPFSNAEHIFQINHQSTTWSILVQRRTYCDSAQVLPYEDLDCLLETLQLWQDLMTAISIQSSSARRLRNVSICSMHQKS